MMLSKPNDSSNTAPQQSQSLARAISQPTVSPFLRLGAVVEVLLALSAKAKQQEAGEVVADE
jgi:hypothetical protein